MHKYISPLFWQHTWSTPAVYNVPCGWDNHLTYSEQSARRPFPLAGYFAGLQPKRASLWIQYWRWLPRHHLLLDLLGTMWRQWISRLVYWVPCCPIFLVLWKDSMRAQSKKGVFCLGVGAIAKGPMLYNNHGDVIKWKHFPRYLPVVRRIHRSPVNSPHKGLWRGALVFTLIWAWINRWVNNCEAGNLKRHRAHHDVIIYTYICDCNECKTTYQRNELVIPSH